MDARPQQNPWQRIPRRHRVLGFFIVLFVLAASFQDRLLEFYDWMNPPAARVVVVDSDRQPVDLTGRVDLFQTDRSNFRASPLPLLGSIDLGPDQDTLEILSGEYPNSLQVRFHIPGFGVDYTSVEIGRRKTVKLKLGKPIAVHGLVRDRTGQPIPEANVIAFGGGPRGVVLAETFTGPDGSYTLSGISEHVGFVFIRVLKLGYAVAEEEHSLLENEESIRKKTTFSLVPVPPLRGQIELPRGGDDVIDSTALRVSVAHFPGAYAEVSADGKFVLHHLDAGKRYRLLVQGLPGNITHEMAIGGPGGELTIQLLRCVTLRGQVLNVVGQGLAKVEVWHTHSTRGHERCVTDLSGRFELRSVPLGEAVLTIAPSQSNVGRPAMETMVQVLDDPNYLAQIKVR